MGNLHVAVFFLCDRLVNLQPFFVHSQLHGVEAAPWDLVMQTRKGNVAGATSGASSRPPTSPPLLCCCCCAAVVVLSPSCMYVSALYPHVVHFHLGVGSCACILSQNPQFCSFVVPPVVAYLKKNKR